MSKEGFPCEKTQKRHFEIKGERASGKKDEKNSNYLIIKT